MANKHWFSFYGGDYLADTGHLSPLEHGIYLLLMIHYYRTQKPLPANAMQLQRICKAFADAEKHAIDVVLADFFVLHEDGYHNGRIDQEIRKSNEISEKRSKAAKKRHKKGCKSTANAHASAMQLHTQPQPQPHIVKDKELMSGKPDLQAQEVLAHLNLEAGRNFRPVDSNIKPIVQRLHESSVDEALRVIDDRVHEWKNDEKMSEYLRPGTIFNKTKYHQYLGNLDREIPEGGKNEEGGGVHQRRTRQAEKTIDRARSAATRLGGRDISKDADDLRPEVAGPVPSGED